MLKGSYYAFEGGSLSFNGSTRALHRVKATLFQLAQLRKPYLLGMYGAKQLERYGLSIGYIDALEDHVEKLKVE